MQYYWEIVERDGTITEVPPTAVEVIQRRLDNKQPLNFPTKSILPHEVVKFHITNRPFGQTALGSGDLQDDAAQAFREPLYIEADGEQVMKTRWVKQTVTLDRWNRYYSTIPGYKFLQETGNMAEIAFRMAVHDIDPAKTPYCTDEEVYRLTIS